MYCIILVIALERFRIVTHSCVAAQPIFNRNEFLLHLQHLLFQELKRYTQNQ